MSRDIEQQLLTIVESSIEDTTVPDAIAAHADKRVGKPVTKTDAEQLEAQIGVPVRIRRQYGMTHISWATGSGQNPWRDERSILIANSETGVRWPSGAELRSKEPAYFGARDERNEARRKLLTEHAAQEKRTGLASQADHASAISRAAAAIAKIREARAELEQITDHDQPLNVVLYAVEKLAKEG